MAKTSDRFDPIPLDIEKALEARPDVKAEYDRLEPEYELLNTLLKARKQADMTQLDVAKRMGVKRPSVARLESTGSSHSPSVKTLQKYAEAVGCKLEIKLTPQK
jgi:DNA-binding XRE family transcriptional regulator